MGDFPDDWPAEPCEGGLRSLDGELRCQICHELFTAPLSLQCGHACAHPRNRSRCSSVLSSLWSNSAVCCHFVLGSPRNSACQPASDVRLVFMCLCSLLVLHSSHGGVPGTAGSRRRVPLLPQAGRCSRPAPAARTQGPAPLGLP